MMIILRAGLFFLSLATAWAQSLNTSREFHLHTQLKPGQDGKARFDNLWLYAYHTGAGMNDAMLSANKSYAIPGFLNGTNLEFDLGTQGIPWSMIPDISVNLYAAWEPVRINGGVGSNEFSSFSINATGLQWSDASSGGSAEGFGGWLGKLLESQTYF